MKKTNVINKATTTIGKVGFKLRKYSPEILMVAGVVGVVTGTVMACKATTKVGDILDETSDKLDRIHECAERSDTSVEYTIEDSKKDIAIVYLQTGVKVVKLYAPAATIGVLSLSGIITSNNILRKRNVALAAAYATVDRSFKNYRKRVVERFGDEIDNQLKYNIKAVEVGKTVINEDGNEQTATENVNVIDENSVLHDEYAKFFDSSNPNWEENPEYNLMFLKTQENYANDKLRAKGYLFLNEVYEMLGLEPTKAGQIVGWVYNPENPSGDNFVDFGIHKYDTANIRFVNGYENVILLDFNVDGNIWDLM